MEDLHAEGFVIHDGCVFTVLPSTVVLEGTVACLDGIALEVRKEIRVLRGSGLAAEVQTELFKYHAWVRGRYNIFRYDSAHRHRPFPHKHVFDTFGFGGETAVIELRGEDAIPTMAEVIRELRVWHEQHAANLHLLR